MPLELSTASRTPIELPNPFVPHKNPETGRWAPPQYSRRRQAELIKAAKKEGTLHLLPPGPKLNARDLPPPPASILKTSIHVQQLNIGAAALEVPVKWVGEVKIKEAAGANVGNKLYAGKSQMFKGHKWERVYRRKRKYQRMLMRDMAKRILKWRLTRVTKRPEPLSRIRGTVGKSRFLPF
ncbi:hypothetical protein M422DRAFT_34324 [Sphaerobolus stellatus SS14]|uniref:Large ribosomal subunit protein mL59 domain-containing protein n=1 Tax=Sphaerobolus stellatus (strain SS14) TaxID=990650 RepID=A0A0C9UNC9_SPHS4|nr:hypothetical protein M422DRAFT_34324 [Sphaerobolus stellatus SS14]